MTSSVTKMSSSIRMRILVAVDCMSSPGRFCCFAFRLLCLCIKRGNFSPLRQLRPMRLNCTIRLFRGIFDNCFPTEHSFLGFLTSRFFFCASVSPCITTSRIGSGGSTSSDLSRSRFRTSATFFEFCNFYYRGPLGPF